MQPPKPIEDFSPFLPVLAETMKFAIQSLAQSGAIASALIAKGVLTQAELNAQMKQSQKLSKKLLDLMDAFDPSKPHGKPS